jgi:folylpolyglutamate synthase/dihydropteroate synthase
MKIYKYKHLQRCTFFGHDVKSVFKTSPLREGTVIDDTKFILTDKFVLIPGRVEKFRCRAMMLLMLLDEAHNSASASRSYTALNED